HCNIHFKIYETKLVGRLVNPTFPDQPERWEEVIEIPILSHFYFENAKDSYGRETNTKIENAARSHWEARPWMTLDLSRIRIKNWAMKMFFCGADPNGVEDIEWDSQSNFLGFT